MFPSVYDNKVLASASEYFGRTDLGKIYEKCLQDERLKTCGVKIEFDLHHGFGNYEGSGLLSHYHEAAYDAYMTGFAYAHCLKFKEFDQGPPKKNNGGASKGKAGDKKTPSKEEEKVIAAP